MAEKISGSCLCGAVTYESQAEPVLAGHCHCLDCRKATGGHNTIVALPEAATTLSGQVKAFSKEGDSGNLIHRHFCPNCGSLVFARTAGFEGMVMINAATLDDPAICKPQMTVYACRAMPWDPVAAGIPAFDKMPPPQ